MHRGAPHRGAIQLPQAHSRPASTPRSSSSRMIASRVCAIAPGSTPGNTASSQADHQGLSRRATTRCSDHRCSHGDGKGAAHLGKRRRDHLSISPRSAPQSSASTSVSVSIGRMPGGLPGAQREMFSMILPCHRDLPWQSACGCAFSAHVAQCVCATAVPHPWPRPVTSGSSLIFPTLLTTWTRRIGRLPRRVIAWVLQFPQLLSARQRVPRTDIPVIPHTDSPPLRSIGR